MAIVANRSARAKTEAVECVEIDGKRYTGSAAAWRAFLARLGQPRESDRYTLTPKALIAELASRRRKGGAA